MVATYATGIGLVVVLAVGWAAVQAGWRRVFLPACADPDVLAGRSSCHGCRDRCRSADAAMEDHR